MSDTYVYSIEEDSDPEAVYINLTNKCTNNCVFCIRNLKDPIKGTDLWLKDENVDIDELISQLENFPKAKEVVFCGYGEPTIKMDLLKQIAKYVKDKNSKIKVRVNTNGQGNLINGKDITEELRGLIDEFSISLNAATEEDYRKITQCKNKEAFNSVKDFIKKSAEKGFKTTATVVVGYKDYNVDVEECKKITEERGADFRVREWLDEGY